MKQTNLHDRMQELMNPINKQLLMCDSVEDQLMMASAMIVTCKDIFDLHLTVEGRKEMFKRYAELI